MKILLLLGGLLSLSPAAAAQTLAETPPVKKHLVSVGAFGLAPTIGLEYQQRLGKHFALGVQGARYFRGDYPGYQAALVGRYYFRALAPAGLYAQISAGCYRHQAQAASDYPFSLPPTVYSQTLSGNGLGLGLGYHWLLGPRWVLNTALGLKFYLHDIGAKGGPNYVGDWYATGQPGSVLDGQLSLGYSF